MLRLRDVRPALRTCGHELEHELRVGDVAAAEAVAAHLLTHVGVGARHLICNTRDLQSDRAASRDINRCHAQAHTRSG